MDNLSNDIKELLQLMVKNNVRFAICGGHAVAYHGYPRMTMDVDILVEPTEENAQRVMTSLKEFGFGDAGIPESAFTREGTAITLGEQPNQVDLLTSMSSQHPAENLKQAVWGELAGVKVRFVSLRNLLNAKKEAGRPKDLADIDELNKINK